MILVELAETESAVTIVLAQRKDGSPRFCFDYWMLKAIILHDFYLIPRTVESFNVLGNELILSTVDASCCLWQIEIEDADRENYLLFCIMVSSKFQECYLDCATHLAHFKEPWMQCYRRYNGLCPRVSRPYYQHFSHCRQTHKAHSYYTVTLMQRWRHSEC